MPAEAGRPPSDSRPLAPFGRRCCPVGEGYDSGGYRIFSLIDGSGPEPAPGQFYMLATAGDWEGEGGRPFLPRAISVARTGPVPGAVRDGPAGPGRATTGGPATAGGVRLDFLIEAVGPGTDRLAGLEHGDECWLTGPFGRAFSAPKMLNPGAHGAILVGGGIGIAPLAIQRKALSGRGVPTRTLLGFRDRHHSGGVEELFGCEETRLAFEDGSSGHTGYVTDLLLRMLEGDDSGGGVVYSCGPPAMLEAVRKLCAEYGVPVELALESPMACGFGACFGCAVPKAGGGYLRLCVDGPVVRGDEVVTAMAGEADSG